MLTCGEVRGVFTDVTDWLSGAWSRSVICQLAIEPVSSLSRSDKLSVVLALILTLESVGLMITLGGPLMTDLEDGSIRVLHVSTSFGCFSEIDDKAGGGLGIGGRGPVGG
jgi:hypothetical protein